MLATKDHVSLKLMEMERNEKKHFSESMVEIVRKNQENLQLVKSSEKRNLCKLQKF